MGCKSGHSHLRVWGWPAYVKHLKTDKFRARSDKYNFIGYLKETKGYYFYFTDEQKVFVSLRIIFLEKKFFGERINTSKVELDEVQQIKLDEVQQVEPTQSSEPTDQTWRCQTQNLL